MPFEIILTPPAQEDLLALRLYDRATVLEAIEVHLRHGSLRASRTRIKQLTQPALSQYRLRVGDFRVYYNVEEDRVVILQVYDKGRRVTPQGGRA